MLQYFKLSFTQFNDVHAIYFIQKQLEQFIIHVQNFFYFIIDMYV